MLSVTIPNISPLQNTPASPEHTPQRNTSDRAELLAQESAKLSGSSDHAASSVLRFGPAVLAPAGIRRG